jgi:hypothetical protein
LPGVVESVLDILVGVVDGVVLLGVEVGVVGVEGVSGNVVLVELAVLVGVVGEEIEVLVEDAVDVGVVLAEVEVDSLLEDELPLLEALELDAVDILVLTELELVDAVVVELELVELEMGVVVEGLPELDSVERLVDTTGEVLGLEDMLLLPEVVVETPTVSVLTPAVLTPAEVTPKVVTPAVLNSEEAPELTPWEGVGVVNSGVRIVVGERGGEDIDVDPPVVEAGVVRRLPLDVGDPCVGVLRGVVLMDPLLTS